MLQQQNLDYVLIGDDTTSQYFNFNPADGSISVARSLIQESRDYYIARIVAYDNGSPPRSATVTAQIFITRNLNQPIFNPTIYEETVLETEQTNFVVLRVTATDLDRIVSFDKFIGTMVYN